MSLYLTILTESLISTLWPLKAEVTADAMRLFGGYDLTQASGAGAAGAWMAVMILWGLGMLSYRLLRRQPAIEKLMQSSDNATFFSRGMGMAAMAFVWLPMGFMVALLAGFLRVPAWKIALISALGCGAYYSSQLLWL